MFAGLVLTSISTVMMRAALFQRKSRSGWLEELDGIREDALEEHGGEIGHVVGDADDIWTDLRDGGEYADPHEISSLYATDETPDRPVTKPAAKPAKTASPKGQMRRPKPKATRAPAPDPLPPVDAPLPSADPLLGAPSLSPAAAIDDVWPMHQDQPPAAGTHYDSDQIWVQPAPHPIRPSEMWHPAELAPSPLHEEALVPPAEERVPSAEVVGPDTVDPTYAGLRAYQAQHHVEPDPVGVEPIDRSVVHQLENELVAAADVAVVADPAAVTAGASSPESGGLTAGPVGRRVRRDRPADRTRPELPTEQDPIADVHLFSRGERSPLPTQPLPPAALPTRSNRLPSLDHLPATPSSALPAASVSSFGHTPSPAAIGSPAAAATPISDDPTAPPADTAVPDAAFPEVAVPEVAVPEAAIPEAAIEQMAPPVLEITADGLVGVPGTIVRLGGAARATAIAEAETAVVELGEGWCWVSPGDGLATQVRVDMPNGSLIIEPGATALAVVEADQSAFVIVASGLAELRRGADGGPLSRGAIVMIDPAGGAELDQATDAEIESDPIVAENLALDAEL